jgi:Ca2+-dependent lipid-binding protein
MQTTLFDDEIIWNTETDAVKATINFTCTICGSVINFCIEQDGYGQKFSFEDAELQKHIEKLKEKYHAQAWSIDKVCQNNHKQKLVFIFGETQPARYILAKAAVIG